MESRIVKLLVRASILFALSMVLVFGFWEHRNFYQFGLPALLIGGGLVTFLVILAFRVALSGRFPHGWASGEILVSEAEEDGFRRGATEFLIRRADDPSLPPLGCVVRGRLDGGKAASRLKILEGTRKPLADVTDEDARKAGHHSVSELCESTALGRPRDIVAVLHVERVGGPHD